MIDEFIKKSLEDGKDLFDKEVKKLILTIRSEIKAELISFKQQLNSHKAEITSLKEKIEKVT